MQHDDLIKLATRVVASYGRGPHSEGGNLARGFLALDKEVARLKQQGALLKGFLDEAISRFSDIDSDSAGEEEFCRRVSIFLDGAGL